MRRQVTKQMILITACLVFALALSGTVAAENSQGGGNNDTINVSKEDININCTAIFSGGTNYDFMKVAANKYPKINYTSNLTVNITTSFQQPNPPKLNFSNQNLIFLDLYENSLVSVVESTVNEAKANNATVIVLTPQSDSAKNLSTIGISQHPDILKYFQYSGLENIKRLLKYALVNFFGLNDTVEPPVEIPLLGIYHPDSAVPFTKIDDYIEWYKNNATAHKYNETRPTVGILLDKFFYLKGSTAPVDYLIKKLEEANINCVLEYGSLGDSLTLLMNTTSLKPYIPLDLLITTKQFRLRSYSTEPIEKGVQYMEALNIPIIKGIFLSSVIPEVWMNSTTGVPYTIMGQDLGTSELDGIIEEIVIAGARTDPQSGMSYLVAIEDQIDWMVNRSISWINLRRESNDQKKIAIIYYHPTPGKGDVGVKVEGYLDTHESLVNLLQALKDQGYETGPIPTVDELRTQMQLYGKNVGVWAPGELEIMVNSGKVGLIPLEEYMQWFNALPQANRDEVINLWGEPPGDIMVYENNGEKFIVIPYVMCGNIILAPQPMRGKDQNSEAMFTDTAVPPTHQYIAFYMWMNKVFGADALIHFGRYGSFEYLPGKQSGLSATTDWPAILIQDMPHIYPYLVSETGGATTAKRRANAVIIDYSTPAIIPAALYGDLANLETDLVMYDQTNEETIKSKYREDIINKVKTLNLDKDLNVDLNTIQDVTTFETFKITLRDYLNDLKNEYMPYGLHILGENLTGDYLISMINSMLGADFSQYTKNNNITENQTNQLLKSISLDGKTPEEAQSLVLGKADSKLTDFLSTAKIYAQNLQSCGQEITSILDALEGKYVPPGPGGDPIRKTDVLPSGRNLYSFDPRDIPTKASRDMGVTLANQLIDQYLDETGEYPKKVAFVLWTSETMLHLGVLESEIFTLLGVNVTYDKWNRPTILTLIPSEQLGRPRIDVVVNPSGVYRDTFTTQLRLIDQAIRLAATANDTAYPNYVKINSQSNYEWLISQGFDNATAQELSMARIFSTAPEGYGPTLSVPISHTDKWQEEGEIGDLFTNGWGYIYGQNNWGDQYQNIFSQNLKGVDIATHSRSSYSGILDNDHVFAHLGGLALAVRTVSGKDPKVYINNLRNSNNPQVQSLNQFLSTELRTRNLNPTWIQGMMEHDYYGAAMMSAGVENLWGWTVTNPGSVSQSMWKDVIDTYVYDKNNIGVSQWLSSDSRVYSMISIYGTILKATQKGYIQMDQQTLNDVANRWANLIAQHGTSCCDCSCANLAMVEWATQYVNPDIMAQFNSQMYKSTQNAAFAPSPTPSQPQPEASSQPQSAGATSQSSSQSSGVAGEAGEQSQSENTASPGDQGEAKAYEVTKEGNSGTSDSGLPAAAIVGVVALVCLIGFGYFRMR